MLPRVVIMGPARDAVSGVSEHLNQLMGSGLTKQLDLIHFQVGSEGRQESRAARVLRLIASPLQLAHLLIRAHASAIHLNTSIDRRAFWRDLLYVFVAKALRCKIVYQIHGGILPEQVRQRSPMLSQMFSAFLLLCNAIVVLTTEEERQYRALVRGVPVVRIPNAIDLAPYSDFPERDYQSETPLRLVFIGRLAASKGIYDALEAMDLITQHDAACRIFLAIAGNGPEKERLEKRIAERRLEDRVRLLGPVFDEGKTLFWRNADLFIFPTRREGLPYAVLESLAAGTPVVTTRVGGIPDAVDDGVHGVLLDAISPSAVATAITDLLAHPETLRRMSRACRQRAAERYGIVRLERQFSELYQTLFPNGSSHAQGAFPYLDSPQHGTGCSVRKKRKAD